MLRYIFKRILYMIPVLLGVAFLIYTLMFSIPGDVVKMVLGSNATEEDVAEMTHELGLDQPFFLRFAKYIGNIVLHFDFGNSYFTGNPVTEEIAARFPYTLQLALWSAVVSTVVGVGCGIIAATRQYSVFDSIATVVSLLGVSMPIFWMALMFILVFAIKLSWLPVSGSYGVEYWILPVLTVGLAGAANIMRTTRSSMLETIRQDYIRTARAKGQSEGKVIWVHALKNALIPVITVIGMQFGGILGGSVISETVFAIPGIGKYTIDAIKQRDHLVAMGSIIFLAFCISVINLVIDVLYSFIDPRVKTMYARERRKTPPKGGKEAVSNG